MRKVIQALSNVLSMIKGFDTGTTSRTDNKMILDYEGKRYVLTLTEVKEPDENMHEDIEKYL